MTNSRLTGLVAAPFTPLRQDGSLNLDMIGRQARALADNHVNGAFICGTTGEGLSLATDERVQVAETWMAAATPALRVIVHVGHKGRILFSNPAGERRENMTVRVSYDEGRSWAVSRTIHAGPAAYSCLAVLPDKSVGCLFERGVKSPYETISLARFPLSWLEGALE